MACRLPAAMLTPAIVAALIPALITALVPTFMAALIPLEAPGILHRPGRNHDGRRGITTPRSPVHHDRGKTMDGTARGMRHNAIIMVACRGTDHGTEETAHHRALASTYRMADQRTRASPQQGTGQFIGSHGGMTAESSHTGHEHEWGNEPGFHDSLH